MTILHIISSGGMYGAEAVILNLSRIMNEDGHRSIVGVFANASNPNVELHQVAQREGIESYLIDCAGQIDRAVPQRIRDLVNRIRPDVVHAHGYKADIYAYFALRGSKVPLISTCHTWYDNDLMVTLYGAADRYILRHFARVIAVSEEVKQQLLAAHVAPAKVQIIRNGIDLRSFDEAYSQRAQKQADDSPTVGFVGRLSREKGVDIFLRAATLVLAELPATKFAVIGDGPDRDALAALAKELGIEESLSMPGRRSDMPQVYALLDMLVSASRQEGLPMTILEAMASGLPVVATMVGELPSIIVNGVSGVLVAPEDPEALAEAIKSLLHDPERRRAMSDAARRRIEEEFSATRMAKEYLEIYEEAAGVGMVRSTSISEGSAK